MEREVSENQLVAAAKSGNRDAFGELVERHTRRMMHIARTITRNHQDAEDAVQDAFVSALAHLESFDGRSRFSTWLTRIAINAALMRLRKNRGLREIPIEERQEEGDAPIRHEMRDAALNPEECYAARERHRVLRKAILQLRPNLYSTVSHHLKGGTDRETAQALGISIPAAKARLFHARAALQRVAQTKIMGSKQLSSSSVQEQRRYRMNLA